MKASANTDNLGKFFVMVFFSARAGFRLGVYPAKRDASTFAPASKTVL